MSKKEEVEKTIKDAVAPLKREEIPQAREDMKQIKEAMNAGDLDEAKKAAENLSEKRKSGKYKRTFGKKR